MSRRLISPSLLAIICLVFVNLCTGTCSNCTFTVASDQHIGNITSTNAFVVRDLGYHGTIGSWEINTYGDTFHCQYQDATTSQDCSPVSVNSASTDTDDPRRVTDINPNNGVPRQFVPFDDTEQPGYDWGMGLTNGEFARYQHKQRMALTFSKQSLRQVTMRVLYTLRAITVLVGMVS